jgi:hypothetical protein
MQMGKSELIGSMETGLKDARIEVVLCLALQLSTWHETLGWQSQKTIPLGIEKIGQLQRLLSQTRQQIEERTAPVGAVATIIEFALRGSSSQAVRPATQPTPQTGDQALNAIN